MKTKDSQIISIRAKGRALALACLFTLVAASALHAQQGQSTTEDTATTTNSDWTVVGRGLHTEVWQQSVSQTLPNGQTVARAHKYVEVQVNMNVSSNGVYVPASDVLSPTATGAEATNAAVTVAFLGNINSSGSVSLTTPDGKRLVSSFIGLVYEDTNSNESILFSEVQDSIGEIQPDGSTAVYPEALAAPDSDVIYEYTRAGLEQFVLLHEQPPSPAAWGLNPASTLLECWTEFISPVTPTIIPVQLGGGLEEFLDFGAMQMLQGAAFAIGSETNRIPVFKEWDETTNGTFVLVEKVPYQALAPMFQTLPAGTASITPHSGRWLASRSEARPAGSQTLPNVKEGFGDTKRRTVLTQLRTPRTGIHTPPMKLAAATPRRPGVALDYQLVTSISNMRFQSDTEYYINSSITLTGTNYFEGGTCIKTSTNASLTMVPTLGTPAALFEGAPYRPIIVTAKDDNSIGDAIGGSTGSPSGYYANPFLYLIGVSVAPSHIRIAYARQAFEFGGGSANISDAQFVDCGESFSGGAGTLTVRNALFENSGTNYAFASGGMTASAENCTYLNSSWLITGSTSSSGYAFTNCILTGITNLCTSGLVPTGAYNAFYATTNFGTHGIGLGSTYPCQTVGFGGAYISAAAGSSLHGAGTTNINGSLLADLAACTTYPPLIYSNTVLMASTNLGPQATRDVANGAVDVGYNYPCLDYLFYTVVISNTTLTLNPGTAVALLKGQYNVGLSFHGGGQFISQGSATTPNWLVAYNMVQEQPGPGAVALQRGLVTDNLYSTLTGSLNCQFTDWSVPVLDTYALSFQYNPATVIGCEFHGGLFDIEYSFGITNCEFDRTYSYLIQAPTNPVAVCNSLFHGGTVEVDGLLTNAILRDNFFEGSTNVLADTTWTYTVGHNAYLTNQLGQMNVLASDLILTNDLVWQAGPLGNYYQPSNSPLIQAGSTNANLVGLYHFTTTTNLVNGLEVPDGTNIVSIGYHYVATDAFGNPRDTSGNGADYLLDVNGDGIFDTGDLGDWQISPYGLNSTNALQVFTPLK